MSSSTSYVPAVAKYLGHAALALAAAYATKTVLKYLIVKRQARGKPLPHPPLHPLWQNIPLISERIKRGEHLDSVIVELSANKELGLGKIFTLKLLFIEMVVVNDADAVREVSKHTAEVGF